MEESIFKAEDRLSILTKELLNAESELRRLATELQSSYEELPVFDATHPAVGSVVRYNYNLELIHKLRANEGAYGVYACSPGKSECEYVGPQKLLDDLADVATELFMSVDKLIRDHAKPEKRRMPRRVPFRRIDDALDNLKVTLTKLREAALDADDDRIAEAAAALTSAVYKLSTAYETGHMSISKTDYLFLRAKIDGDELRALRDDLRYVSEKLGRKVGYLVPSADPGEGVSFAAALNDLANAVHVVAEEAIKKYGVMEKRGKCYVSDDAEEAAAKFCEAWDRFTEKGKRLNLYAVHDGDELMGIVKDGEVMLRVGSAKGHATHVKFEGNKINVRYYDIDALVNVTMKALFEDAGCKAEVLSDGVEAACPSEAADKVAAAISLATSMDIRLAEKRVFMSDDAEEYARKELEKLLNA